MIRYVAVVESFRTVGFKQREGLTLNTPNEIIRNYVSIMPPILIDSVAKLTPYLGEVELVSVRYAKVLHVYFRRANFVAVASFDPGTSESFSSRITEAFNRLSRQYLSWILQQDLPLRWETGFVLSTAYHIRHSGIQEKATELGRYLNGRSPRLDFSEPAPILKRTDNRAVREAILRLTQAEARKPGVGKSTLHYLRKKACSNSSFHTCAKTREKILKA